MVLMIILVSCNVSNDKNIDSKNSDFEKKLAILKLENSDLYISEVIGYLTEPWEITYGPDQHLWFTEHMGFVSRLNPGSGGQRIHCCCSRFHPCC